MELPDFDSSGNLPPGVHHTTWEELTLRFGTNSHRRNLLQGLLRAARDLRRAGCQSIYVDGSFVSTKEVPGDYDACFELAGVDLVYLQKIAPEFFSFSNGRAAQKAKYLGEWFPAEMIESDSRKQFLNFFQQSRDTGEAKGVVVIDIRSLP